MLTFANIASRVPWGSLGIFAPSPPATGAPAHAASDHSLATIRDVDLLVLHDYALRAFGLQLLKGEAGILIDVHHAGRGIREAHRLAWRQVRISALFE